MKGHKIGVIGGGASGMAAAIAAAEHGADVTLLEGGERVGKKLLSTGNGKCNLGNLELGAEDYYCPDKEWLSSCLARFGTEETIRFFGGLGLLIKEKNGYLYPVSEQAAVVLDVLRIRLKELMVKVVTDCRAERITRNADGFDVWAGNRHFQFERVILTCGGKAAPHTGSDGSGFKLAHELGHNLIPPVPALVQLRCRENSLKSVAGVRADAEVRVKDAGGRELVERGEVQLTDYGISGIPVFQLSREVNCLLLNGGNNGEVEVSINFFPDYSGEEFAGLAERRRRDGKHKSVEEFFTGMLHKKLMALFIKTAGLRPNQLVESADADKLDEVFKLCRDFRVHVTGSNSYENAQACAGGVDISGVGGNMESLLVPGLFFAGEILDVDGRCGGYNLQWAWCSGFLAGQAAAEMAN